MDQHANDRYWVEDAYPSQHLEVDGRIQVYREAGEAGAPVIVLLHGIGSGSGSWAYLLDHFQARYRLIAWDAPGYNFSTPLPEDKPGAFGYARALGEFLSVLEVDPAAVIGHSLGAMMAGAYAADVNPGLPVLILGDPANGYGESPQEVHDQKLEYRLDMVRELGPEGMADKRSANLLSENPPPEAVEMVKWNMRKTTTFGYEQASHTLADGHLKGRAGEFGGRVLVLCGGEDHVTPVDACREVAVAYNKAPFYVLPGLGHASYVEGPDLFNQAVETFLEAPHA